ncbi:SemiSWEET family sugar transporter [Candidatus Omnitrophota bacterium]
MHILGLISAALFTTCFLPQIIKILRTKNVSGISRTLWIMIIAGYVTGLIYVIHLDTPILIVSYSVGLLFSLITASLVFYFSRKSSF